MKTNDHGKKLTHALALIEGQLQEALGRRKGIHAVAQSLHDDWQDKIAKKGPDPAREERRELRLASLLVAQEHGAQD